MKTMKGAPRASRAALATATMLGCADLQGGLDIAVQESQERPAQSYIYRSYLSDPDSTAVSYAVGSMVVPAGSAVAVSGGAVGSLYCPGTFIGPNLFMTAAHCAGVVVGPAVPPTNARVTTPTPIHFNVVRNLGAPNASNAAVQDSEQWAGCTWLLHTFNASDMLLLHCPNNAAGIGPGDKYGYVDAELSTARHAVGRAVYSVYHEYGNLAATPTAPSVTAGMRYRGTGAVTSTTASIGDGVTYYNLPTAPGAPNVATTTSVWAYGGVSGSAQFDAVTHRILVGPTSIGGEESPYRGAFSMYRYIWYAKTFTTNPDPVNRLDSVNDAYINSLNLTASHTAAPRSAAAYRGTWVDLQPDGLIDVQQDIEWTRGENARDWYNLSFNSLRRNALWTAAPTTTLTPNNDDPRNYSMRVVNGFTGVTDVLTHTRLNLTPGTYRMTFRYRTNSATSSGALYAGIREASGSYNVHIFPTVASPSYSLVTRTVTVAGAGASLVIRANNLFDIDFKEFSLVRQGAVMNFDTFDRRDLWRNPAQGLRAAVVPDGRTTGTPNWAAYVSYNAAQPSSDTVASEHLAFSVGVNYQVCFWHRAATGSSAQGRVTVTGTTAFTSSASWAQTCFNTGASSAEARTLSFGVASSSNTTPYLVDDITVTPI